MSRDRLGLGDFRPFTIRAGGTSVSGMEGEVRDTQFLHAIALGAALGIPVVWVVMTLIFLVVTDQPFGDIAGYSALPAFFCGPFLGGLFTTAAVNAHEAHRTS
jgi:hypothetical protein